MGYDSKAILNDIHKADPLPSKGKIDKRTKLINLNKSFDALLTDDEYNAASFIYLLITTAYKVKIQELKQKKNDDLYHKYLDMLEDTIV